MNTHLVRFAALAATWFATSSFAQTNPKPVAAKPVAAKPVAAKPVAAKPVAAKPVLEVVRVSPGDGVKTRKVPFTNLGKTVTLVVEQVPQLTEAGVRNMRVTSQKQKVTSGTKTETREVPVLTTVFTPAGNKILNQLSKEWQGKQIAVIIDGKVIATPLVSKVFTGGESNLTGNFTKEEAAAMAAKVNAAPRPEGVGELLHPSLFGSSHPPQPTVAAPATPAPGKRP